MDINSGYWQSDYMNLFISLRRVWFTILALPKSTISILVISILSHALLPPAESLLLCSELDSYWVRRNGEQLALLSRREAVGSYTGRYKDRTNTDGVDQKPGFPPANSILLSSKLGEAIIFHRVSFLPGP